MRRTDAGLTLELLLSKLPNRYLLCWTGEKSEAYDCACCITWPTEELYRDCGCICHERVETMASDPNIRLWLLASVAMDEFPFIASSVEEQVEHERTNSAAHKAWKRPFACECSDCEATAKQDMKREQHESEKGQACDCFYCNAIRRADSVIAESAKVE